MISSKGPTSSKADLITATPDCSSLNVRNNPYPNREGAKGDGIIDDWAAISDSISWAKDHCGEAAETVIFFPAGRYRIEQSVYMLNTNNMILRGELSETGSQLAILVVKKEHRSALIISGAKVEKPGSHNIRVENLAFQGPWDTVGGYAGDGAGIMVGQYVNDPVNTVNSQIVFDHVLVTGFTHAGIMLYGGANQGKSTFNENITVSNSTIEKSQNGIFVYQNAKSVYLHDNTLRDLWGDGIAVDTCDCAICGAQKLESMPIYDIQIWGNTLKNIGLKNQAIGIMAKGDIRPDPRNLQYGIYIHDNTITDVGVNQQNQAPSYGILLGRDGWHCNQEEGAIQGKAGVDPVVTGNTITNVDNHDHVGTRVGIMIWGWSKTIHTAEEIEIPSVNTVEQVATPWLFKP
jgi:hypothetical protein